MAFGTDDLFAGGVNLDLQTVDAAIDLDYQRLQIDRFALVVNEAGTSRFSRGGSRFNSGDKSGTIFFKLVKLAFEGQQRFVCPARVFLAADQNPAPDQP